MTRLTDEKEAHREDLESTLALLSRIDRILVELDERARLAIERFGPSITRLLEPVFTRHNEIRVAVSKIRALIQNIYEHGEQTGWGD